MTQVIDTGAGFCMTGRGDAYQMRWQVTGDLDIFQSSRLKQVLESSVRRGCLRHTVDLTLTRSMDASGIHHLVQLHKLLAKRGELQIRADTAQQPGKLLASTGAARILRVSFRGDVAR